MTKYLIPLFALLHAQLAAADLLNVFRLEDGHTNWQYVANTGGTALILTLSYTIYRLIASHREAKRYNEALEQIRSQLEERVLERTATLDESNSLLQRSNAVLESEIAEHRATTERLQQSESYIANILSSMPLMLIGLNREGIITQWNRRAEELSGLGSEQAIGQNLWQAYPMITVIPQQVEQAWKSNKPITVKQSQRGHFYFDVTIYPLEEHGDTGVVILIDDVTNRVMTENMLIQRDKMSSMGELAASMAFDINAPLTGIVEDIRNIQRHLQEGSAAAQEEPVALLEDALLRGRQASAVINNLLEFSRASGGEKRLADVTKIIDHSLALASDVLAVPSGLKFRDIRIERQYAADLPQINCYVAELQQVFLSLFRHSCHALGQLTDPSREPRITIEASNVYDALWIKIQHNGKGISLEEQQFIFEPFFTDTSQSSEADYEAGRRLSFSNFIITEQHRGELAVTSDIDEGTTFHIQLRPD